VARQPRDQKHRHKPVSNRLFQFGNGLWSFFDAQAVYPDRKTAKAAWQGCRREVWAQRQRFMPPKAAREYDGLTSDALELISSGAPLDEVLDALRRDRRAVDRFERRDPR